MPQMAPLNWLILFMFFTIIFILFNTVNYYSFMYNVKQKIPIKNTVKFNWKW
uniref:ATP synthase complex subunit 8 n=1 Tax=Aeolesthes oenochrous TaxID=1162206 RepID=A0A090ARR5_9CUCU|nr:ATP synthase F0 subunit 8 [Aeolesthes oenochrous]BAP59122.1 ATP synthase F0 subunit 8 [Aeolesthes oenochrous]